MRKRGVTAVTGIPAPDYTRVNLVNGATVTAAGGQALGSKQAGLVKLETKEEQVHGHRFLAGRVALPHVAALQLLVHLELRPV